MRYGKRGNLMRYGKRGNLMRYGKREDKEADQYTGMGGMFRYGKRDADDATAYKRLFRYYSSQYCYGSADFITEFAPVTPATGKSTEVVLH